MRRAGSNLGSDEYFQKIHDYCSEDRLHGFQENFFSHLLFREVWFIQVKDFTEDDQKWFCLSFPFRV